MLLSLAASSSPPSVNIGSSIVTVVEFTVVVVPLTIRLPPTVTPPVKVATSFDWLPIVKLPPISAARAVLTSSVVVVFVLAELRVTVSLLELVVIVIPPAAANVRVSVAESAITLS